MKTPNPPELAGLHHLKLPVSDLDASLAWYQRVFGAQHLAQFDHIDDDGARYAVIVALPGLSAPLELRWAPGAAGVIRGYDPLNLAVAETEDLDAWERHFNTVGVDHSSVIQGGAGKLLVVADPDGIFVRLADVPDGGPEKILENISMPKGNPEPDDPWLNPPSMQHPAPGQ